MVSDMALDVMNGFWQLGDTHFESAISFLPHAPRPRYRFYSARWAEVIAPPVNVLRRTRLETIDDQRLLHPG